jgi:hypothetical protein
MQFLNRPDGSPSDQDFRFQTTGVPNILGIVTTPNPRTTIYPTTRLSSPFFLYADLESILRKDELEGDERVQLVQLRRHRWKYHSVSKGRRERGCMGQ